MMWWLSASEQQGVYAVCGLIFGMSYELLRALYPALRLPDLPDGP